MVSTGLNYIHWSRSGRYCPLKLISFIFMAIFSNLPLSSPIGSIVCFFVCITNIRSMWFWTWFTGNVTYVFYDTLLWSLTPVYIVDSMNSWSMAYDLWCLTEICDFHNIVHIWITPCFYDVALKLIVKWIVH